MLALQSQYPNGMTWNNDNFYASQVLGGGYGCAGFAYILSDAAFGNNPSQTYYSLDLSQVRVGDILRIYNDTHSVVVLEVSSGGVTVAEGNINNSIYWGRFIPLSELQADSPTASRGMWMKLPSPSRTSTRATGTTSPWSGPWSPAR